jgi:hypothetical protein
MFSIMDSQPQEWLLNDPNALHTLCICCFRDSAHAWKWIHTLIPRNQHGKLLKWSSGSRKKRTERWGAEFIDAMERNYDDIDFRIQCISSTEGEISNFAQAFYLQNLENVSQALDAKGKNCLVFRVSKDKQIAIPVLRAAKLLWIYFCLKYMKEFHQLDGVLYSDWFACDSMSGEHKALGVSMVNFLLTATKLGIQISIATDPKNSEADILADWLVGWCNFARSTGAATDFAKRFEILRDRDHRKFEAIEYACNMEIPTELGTT